MVISLILSAILPFWELVLAHWHGTPGHGIQTIRPPYEQPGIIAINQTVQQQSSVQITRFTAAFKILVIASHSRLDKKNPGVRGIQ
jgi:hypothetical protein